MSQTTDFLQYVFLIIVFALTLGSQASLLLKCMRAKPIDRLSSSILMNMFWWWVRLTIKNMKKWENIKFDFFDNLFVSAYF